MKKLLSVITLLILVLVVGCASKNNQKPNEQTTNDTKQSQQKQSDNQTQPNAVQDTAGIQNDTSSQITNDQDDIYSPSYYDEDNFIGDQRAKEIALEKAGLGADEVIFEKIELDFDDGSYQYEVDFRKGRTEYSADIRATDGKIIDWETDFDD